MVSAPPQTPWGIAGPGPMPRGGGEEGNRKTAELEEEAARREISEEVEASREEEAAGFSKAFVLEELKVQSVKLYN